MVHEYKEVDIKILWEVIQINIPQLLQQMQTSLAEMKE
ncbi:MAG: DUF86 domain-containing protein [Coleofasciculus sp. C1-SOL-03]